jgi:hypothetical protein
MRGNLLARLGLTTEEVTRDAKAILRQFHP